MVQFAVPDADTATGAGWNNSGFARIDEGAPGDDVVADQDSGNASAFLDKGLTDVTDPASSSGHILRARWRTPAGARTINGFLEVWQGTPGSGTLISTLTQNALTGTLAINERVLTGPQADNITDYSAIQLRCYYTYTGGGQPSTFEIDFIEFEVPDGGTAHTATPTEAVGVTDSTPRVHTAERVKAEAVGVTDDTTRIHTAEREQSEPVGVTDVVATAMTKVRGEVPYLDLPGTATHYASTPDHASLDITGDIDLRVRVALDDWTPAATEGLLAKATAAGNNRAYKFVVDTAGLLVLQWSTDGSLPLVTEVSTVATGIADGAAKHVRATLDVDNDASGYDVNFYTSDNGAVWTQLGTTVVGGATTSIAATTAILEVGTGGNVGGLQNASGTFYEAQVLDGIDGTLVADFDAADFNAGDTDTDTAVDATGKTWTINGADSIIGPIVRVTDTVVASITKQRDSTEAVGVTDTVLPAKSIVVEITEAVGVTDTTSRIVPAVREITEPVGITDDTPIKQSKVVTEAVGVTDDTPSKLTIAQEISEAVGVTDSIDLKQGKAVDEAVGVTDALTLRQAKEISEAVGVTDDTPHVQGGDKFETATEAVSVIDSTSRQIDAERSSDEPVGVTDSVLPAKTIRVTITEAVGVTDGTTPAQTAAVAITEPVGVTDDTVTAVTAVRAVIEPVGVVDETIRDVTAARIVTEPVAAADVLAPAKMVVQEITENVGITDAAVGVIGGGINYQIEITEAVGVTDSVATSAAPWWTKTPVGTTKLLIGYDKRTGDEETPGG